MGTAAGTGAEGGVTRNSCRTGLVDTKGSTCGRTSGGAGQSASKQSCLFRSLAVHFVSFLLAAKMKTHARARSLKQKTQATNLRVEMKFNAKLSFVLFVLLLLLPD